mmetsp:Transcript_32212/g.37550  ORF Transcript_32212/g.37550 Transcript_32212/m.37550 type:complete len:83 (+) Transcript_32212:886-1134(+)
MQNPQNVCLRKYFTVDPTIDPDRQTKITGLRPSLSERVPVIEEAIAVPSNDVMGMKYVAEEKSNGLVEGKDSSCAFGSTMIA